jgi:iron complex transport system substrate-binding protein
MKRLLIFILMTALLAAAMPLTAQESDCITDFDPNTNYFPEQAAVTHANGLEIEYHGHYKILRTLTPFPGASDPFEYVLVMCGTPEPDDVSADALVIEIPFDRSITLTTTILPQVEEIGVLDSLVGLDSFAYVNNLRVREMIASDRLVEAGFGSAINVEVVLASEADVVFTYGYDPSTDAHPVLLDAGIPTAVTAEWLETTPLGRAEWIKFSAAFFNREAEANAAFAEIVAEYETLAALAADIPPEAQPMMLPNFFSNTEQAWNLPGADSYLAQLMRDAGVQIVLGGADDVQGQVGSVPYSFEAVYEAGLDADFWIPNAFAVNTLDDLLALDERYADFSTFQNGGVWNNTARVNENGGNDYWETGVTNPHLLLADLIAIFHPDLLPDHELLFFVNLQ